jgi:hypothetical protein
MLDCEDGEWRILHKMGNSLENEGPHEHSEALNFEDRKARGPGRPTLADEELIELRDKLLWLLSVKWVEVGWELPRAQSLEELRRSLQPLAGHPYDYLINRFVHPAPIASSAEEIRVLRRNRAVAVEKQRDAQSDYERCVAEAAKAEQAMNETQTSTQQPFFSNLLKRWKDRKQAQVSLDAAQSILKSIEQNVAEKEAGFCQSELVDFIESRNYARTPLGLANAMAGLPDMAWETSRERCSKIKVETNFHYQVFLTVVAIWKHRDRYPALSKVELFRREVLRLPKTKLVRVSGLLAREKGTDRIKLPNNVRSYFVENWPYLKRAIEQTEIVKSHPDRVPFLILAVFARNLERPRIPQDLVRADLDKIE